LFRSSEELFIKQEWKQTLMKSARNILHLGLDVHKKEPWRPAPGIVKTRGAFQNACSSCNRACPGQLPANPVRAIRGSTDQGRFARRGRL
ncbi:MAG TPA: hypothetical protein VN887_12475, partial [Candidatus Angelobacter sp.]|nr:hypothetical protein [Candidatus Angelobacter sp.]